MSVETEVLGEVLAGEHAAVYGYGVVAGALAGPARSAALAALDAHRARRDELRRRMLDADASPVEAAPAYQVPRLLDPPAAAQLAAGIEQDLALAYGVLVTASTAADRAFAARALAEAAARETGWRGTAPRFPGRVTAPAASPTPGLPEGSGSPSVDEVEDVE